MVAKDWKVGRYGHKNFTTFYNSNRDIVNVGRADIFSAFGSPKDWRVSINGKLQDKKFKTKQQALKFAKSYMRKN